LAYFEGDRILKRSGRTANDAILNRRGFLQIGVLGAAATIVPPALGAARPVNARAPAPEVKAFELEEITIDALQDGMKSGK